ncbi:hypothetical protein K7X08_016499 [Anisodus acutangulus]|uniref:Uncharacterized protein n=1 Tax=Anisodus acutangulus TaxID=402998 RepID=A0A9Q1LHQ4_9SOLA|nr:hypothetical protein K7X08_016499 [Anisodus acutangulus]
MEQDYIKNFLPYDDEETDPIMNNLKSELKGLTELNSSKHASKALSRFAKEPKEAFDVEVTHSEDFGGNSVANDDGGHVDAGTSRDRVEPSGGQSVDVPAAEPEKVIRVPIAEVEKAPEVIVQAVPDEKTIDVPTQFNGKIVSDEVKVDSEKLVEGVIA